MWDSRRDGPLLPFLRDVLLIIIATALFIAVTSTGY